MSNPIKNRLSSSFWCLPIIFSIILFSCQDVEQEKIQEVFSLDMQSQFSLPDFVPGQYIVMLHDDKINFRKSRDFFANKENMRREANQLLSKYNIPEKKFLRAMGTVKPIFGVQLNEEEYNKLKLDPSIKSIHNDIYLYPSFQRNRPPKKDEPKDDDSGDENETNQINWGQDRIDQRLLPLDGEFNRVATGKGVKIFIIDSGINPDHEEFGGRVSAGWTSYESALEDCSNHGTPVAGLAGGNRFGVAKDAELISCRIFPSWTEGCEAVATGIEFYQILDSIASYAEGPTVVNMSFGGPGNQDIVDIWEDFLINIKNQGIVLIASAGNQSDNACNYTPAGAPSVFAVGASNIDDTMSGFSNWGSCIELFAPGNMLKTASALSNSSYFEYFGGTSAAAPIVAGVAALYLEQNPSASVDEVYDFLRNTSTKNVIRFSESPNNNLIYSLLNTEGANDNADYENPDQYQLNINVGKGSGQRWFVSLNWSPFIVNDSQMDIYEDGSLIMTVQNRDWVTLEVSGRNLPPRTYKVCKSGTTECSNEAVAIFK